MAEWKVDRTEPKKPVNRIVVSGNQIIDIDLNEGWEITDVAYNDMQYDIDWIVVKFEKRRKQDAEI